ncbi:phage integrase [Mycobacteroides abscessus subsp. abscessus]|uniref:tyrosine-type recombinase/integrase n=1 Tax=Mycobacteroides abscessus TaxID=36809 RepID=UPI0009A59C1B|nr:site-specific integrase [Mycobacteroides abscessus]SKU67218.1 phage integrase [Mycobacteroides abscessus subsp. abscessus]SLH66775.1 phage integrase [Mycobacteroides abscessus subsp. abscessus]
MSDEPQRRKANAYIEDTWTYTRGAQKGERKPKYGVGERWRVHVVGLDGERESESFARKVDAEVYRDDVKSRLLQGNYVTEKAGMVTVSTVWEVYLSHQKRGKTKDRRVSAWNTWVSPKWARRAVRDVTRSGVKAWIVEMTEAGAGAATVESATEVLRGVLQVAVDDKRLATNVARGHKLPARTKVNKAFLNHEQVWLLADEFDPRYRTLVLFLSYAGLRFGEAAALSVADLDLLRKQVHVRQQVSESTGGLSWTPTKGRQDRWVPLESFLLEPLAAECEGKKRDDLVFAAPKGGVLRLNTWRERIWNPTIETLCETDGLNFPDVTPHDLRHTAASLAVQAGANVKALQAMLGHEDATLTLNTYAELFPEDLAQVSTQLEKAVTEMLARRAK